MKAYLFDEGGTITKRFKGSWHITWAEKTPSVSVTLHDVVRNRSLSVDVSVAEILAAIGHRVVGLLKS